MANLNNTRTAGYARMSKPCEQEVGGLDRGAPVNGPPKAQPCDTYRTCFALPFGRSPGGRRSHVRTVCGTILRTCRMNHHSCNIGVRSCSIGCRRGSRYVEGCCVFPSLESYKMRYFKILKFQNPKFSKCQDLDILKTYKLRNPKNVNKI